MARCGAEHPDGSSTCLVRGEDHGHHQDANQRVWPNQPVLDAQAEERGYSSKSAGQRKLRQVAAAASASHVEKVRIERGECAGCIERDKEIARLRSFLSAKERKQMRDDSAHAHTDDPETSKMAAAMHSGPKRWENRLKVLAVLVEAGQEGATDDEMVEMLGPDAGAAYSTFRTCRTELRNLNLVRDTGERRPSRATGEPCVVWGAIHDARARFDELRQESLRRTASH